MSLKVKVPQMSLETEEKIDKEINLVGVIFLIVIVAFICRCVVF